MLNSKKSRKSMIALSVIIALIMCSFATVYAFAASSKSESSDTVNESSEPQEKTYNENFYNELEAMYNHLVAEGEFSGTFEDFKDEVNAKRALLDTMMNYLPDNVNWEELMQAHKTEIPSEITKLLDYYKKCLENGIDGSQEALDFAEYIANLFKKMNYFEDTSNILIKVHVGKMDLDDGKKAEKWELVATMTYDEFTSWLFERVTEMFENEDLKNQWHLNLSVGIEPFSLEEDGALEKVYDSITNTIKKLTPPFKHCFNLGNTIYLVELVENSID